MTPPLSPARLPAGLRPAPVTVTVPSARQVGEAGRELRRHAQCDADRCWGYFPALAGRPGIGTALPACGEFARTLPTLTVGGMRYQFSFLRLALVAQGGGPAYHLDSDAATALTGDPATLHQRQVGRLLLNLSTALERTLHYLDLDVSAAALSADSGYVQVSGGPPAGYAAAAVIAPRSGRVVHGVSFLASHVLHSGVDGRHGHFVAAYGYEQAARLLPSWNGAHRPGTA